MYGEKEPFDQELNEIKDENDSENQVFYYEERYDAPKWQPDPEKYNTEYKTVKKRKKNPGRWIVPMTVVLAVLVAVIIVGLTVGSKYITKLTNNNRSLQVSAETAEIESDVASITDDNNVVWTDVEPTETVTDGYVITDVSDIVDEVFPAVVSITSRTIINDSSYYNFFFGNQGSPFGNDSEGNQKEVDAGIGSGTIIGQNDEELLILTSYHVVEGSSSLAVTFVNGTSIDGVIKSASDETDIAIVSVPLDDIDDETMSEIRMAKLSTKPAEMGEGVIVIGNAMGYGMSVTTGIVSAVERDLTIEGKTLSVIQTDAAINSGNSGGCMLNKNGELIGISEAKIIVTGVEGMCYAIPISTNAELIQGLLNEETVIANNDESTAQQGQGAYLGIRGRDITSELAETYEMPQGVYVISVVSGGGAEAAGLLDGDIITAMDGQDTTTMAKLQYELAKHNEGDVVKVTVMRQDGNRYVQADIDVTLTGQIS